MGFGGAIKSGGGFLNNVDGEVTGYEFTPIPPNSKVKSDWMYLVPSIKVDGADDEVTQHFFLGAAADFDLSKDGQSLSADGGITIGGKTPVGRLLASMLAHGLDESELPDLEAGEDLELSALVGKRFRFIQEIDEEANAKLGKRKVKDKKGKIVEYNRTNTLVSQVYGAAEKTGKGGTSAKPGGKKSKNDGDDLTEEADAVLLDVLSDNDGSIDRGKLSLALTKKLMKNPNREALKKLILTEEYLGREEGWSFDADSKKQTIEAA